MYEYMANGCLKDHLHCMLLQFLNLIAWGGKGEEFVK